MTFLICVLVFVACACVVVPLLTLGVCAARGRKRTGHRRGRQTRLSFLRTDGVR